MGWGNGGGGEAFAQQQYCYPALRERIFHSHLIMGVFVTSEAVTLLRRVLDRPTIF